MARKLEACLNGPARATLAAMLAALGCTNASATEGGGSSKALGVDTVMAGVMPPPGLRLTTFVGGYYAHGTLDREGSPRAGISNFDLKVVAITLRLQYVWPGVTWLGADVET